MGGEGSSGRGLKVQALGLVAIVLGLASVASAVSAPSAGDGNDRLVGTPDRDSLHGHGGDDRLLGLGERDHLRGGTGNDLFWAATDTTR